MPESNSCKVAKYNLNKWGEAPAKAVQSKMLKSLEHAGVLFFPELKFNIEKDEKVIFDPNLLGMGCKKIIYDLEQDVLKGLSSGAGVTHQAKSSVENVMRRFAITARDFVHQALPQYANDLKTAGTSFRTSEVVGGFGGCGGEVRKKDQLLHVDAFATNPVNGDRILRLYANINPDNQDRVWHLGDDFCTIIKRFAPQVARPMLFSRTLMRLFGRTKSSRSLYDHYMLSINNLMQKDKEYQEQIDYTETSFPSGSSWLAFCDQISYGILSGQYVLEQSFYLPVKAMKYPDQSPLKQLQKFYGKSILDI